MADMNKCERAEELVGYLYGETTAAERRGIEQHLRACAACRDELAAFGAVRASVGEWHAEVSARAAAVALPAFAPNEHPTADAASVNVAFDRHDAAPRPSLRAALRAFFTLAPGWARAGSVAAALALCALAALAVVNAELRWDDGGVAFKTHLLRDTNQPQPDAPQVAVQPAAHDAQADVARLTAERDAALRELNEARAQLATTQQSVASLTASLSDARAAQRQLVAFSQRGPRAVPASQSRRGLTARPQLASSEPDDEGLRLSDLLTEVSADRNAPPGKRD